MSRYSLMAICCVMLTACAEVKTVPFDLRTEYLVNPLSMDTPHPRLSWKINAGDMNVKQIAYQILVASNETLLEKSKADLWDSGELPSGEQLNVQYIGKSLDGQKLVYWKVRIRDNKGKWSAWSATARFGSGLSDAEIDAAEYIGLPTEMEHVPPIQIRNPAPLVRKTIDYKGGTALLYINSLGYHEIYINGQKVGDAELQPAVSQYDKRSLYNTYDVTKQLHKGANELVVWLGTGWYKKGMPGVVYDSPLLKAWLYTHTKNGWELSAVTDTSWQVAQSGCSDMGSWFFQDFIGERVDARIFPKDFLHRSPGTLKWQQAATVKVPKHIVSPQMTEDNHVAETLTAKTVMQLGDSIYLLDFGKAIIGGADIRFPRLQRGQKIKIEYAEHLDEAGNFAEQNQTDMYIASGEADESFRNHFTYRGIRFVRISGLKDCSIKENCKIFAVSANDGQSSTFVCSDPDLNAIHDMLHHTLRNLCASGHILSDASYERLGYGGDGLAATPTAQTMFNLAPMYANWLAAWTDCIRPDGGLPHTAPCPYQAGGGPYWCGFIIMAPWSSYVQYADRRILENCYPAMKQWLGYVERYKIDGLLQRWQDVDYRNHGWYLGDWASPEGTDDSDPRSVEVINNSFICICYRTMAQIAEILGEKEEAQDFAKQAETIKTLINQRCFDPEKNIYGSGAQIDMAIAMLADIPSADIYPKVKQNLMDSTEMKHKGHIACGLVGIPIVTEWAIRNNAPDFIYSMLKKRDYPGYLYMLEKGGTATWEHWNANRSHIHNCFNGLGSWFYQAIGGIQPLEPGYRKISICPQIPKGVTWAKITKQTPYGALKVNWELKDGAIIYDIKAPTGCEVEILNPQ